MAQTKEFRTSWGLGGIGVGFGAFVSLKSWHKPGDLRQLGATVGSLSRN
ncbi:MAG: hypothetical protein AAFP00_10490 [Bacteroidota bacterium]